MTARAHEPIKAQEHGHEKVNILLVDDHPAKLLSYEVILAELGENLIRANSAREALEHLLKTEVAVVLVDVCMPELDGFELARMLREHPRYEKTAIIFISAIHLSDVDRIRGYQTGAVDYVPVPVIPEILRAKVRIFTELYRKTRQLQKLNDELELRVLERTAALEASTARLTESEERLRTASEAAGFGTYDYTFAAGQMYWSAHLRDIVGLAQDEPLTIEKALQFVHAEHRDIVRQHMQASEPGRREIEFKVVRTDGQVRWLLDRGQPVISDVDGERVCRVTGTVLDITERKLGEERQQLLMAELDHRVKNILSNVSAVAHLSSHRAGSVEDFVRALDGRILAMSRAHGLLRRSAWGGADLCEIAAETLSAFRSRAGDNIRIEGASTYVVPQLAQSLTLILHELATNAVKYGALSKPDGRVHLSWSRTESGSPAHLRIIWREEGGPPVAEPDARGFGLTVLQAAASDIAANAGCHFAPQGLIYTLEGPFELEHVASQASARPAVGWESAPAAPGAAPSASRRILIVEDEALVAMQLQADLESDGHRVIGPARRLQHGVALAECEDVDLALLDVSLGEETSAAIADALRARRIPFAFATGYSSPDILPEHLRSAPTLNKPYLIEDVRRMIGSLAGHEPPRE